MKKVLKFAIVIIIAVVCWKAYTATQKNDKSFFSNMGKEKNHCEIQHVENAGTKTANTCTAEIGTKETGKEERCVKNIR